MAWPFFVLGVVIMGLLAVNLFLASITFSYLELRQTQRQKQALDDAHQTLVSILMGGNGAVNSDHGAGHDESIDMDTDQTPLTFDSALHQWCYNITHGTGGERFDNFILITVLMSEYLDRTCFSATICYLPGYCNVRSTSPGLVLEI